MFAFSADNVNHALQLGVEWLLTAGVEEDSRNGPVLVAPGPVCTTYLNPMSNVLLSPTRDANPYFHFMEALWMLAGRRDVSFLKFFNSRISQYSDDATTFHGAYGYRWRNWFGYDQLDAIVKDLSTNPNSRRAVLSMWDGGQRHTANGAGYTGPADGGDLTAASNGGKDVPCNTAAYFDLRGDVLNMTVLNRSNDAVWGCYGANAVHFSFLLAYMAARLKVDVGVYRQVSNNLHVYTDVFSRDKLRAMADESSLEYEADPMVMIGDAKQFDYELKSFMAAADSYILASNVYVMNRIDFGDLMLREVATPMFLSWAAHKRGDRVVALQEADKIWHNDWSQACIEWLDRRAAK